MSELPHLTPEQRQQIYEEERLKFSASTPDPPTYTAAVGPQPPPINVTATPLPASTPNQKSKVSRPVAIILTLIGVLVAARINDVLARPEHLREDQQKSASAPALS